MNKGNLDFNVSLAGRFKADVLKDGKVVRSSEWTDNIITDAYLDAIMSDSGDPSLWTISVGTGTSTPTAQDIGLENSVGSTANNIEGNNGGQTSVEPYYGFVNRTYLFGVGDVSGNLTEVGLGIGGSIFSSRALFVDEMGGPTSITVLADEQLRIVYEMRCYAPIGDIVTTVDGYTVTARPARMNGSWNPLSQFSSNANTSAYEGTLGGVTGNPSGTNDGSTSNSVSSYTNGTFSRTASFTWDTSAANFVIQSFEVFNLHNWQIGVSPSIDKTSNDLLTLDVTISLSQGQPS